jgi:hypothetical protein
MKTLVTLLLVATASATYAKPGGWIKDFFQGSSFSYSSGYYPQQRSHCRERVYHCEPAVIYYEPVRPTYHYHQPRYIPMQPYQSFQWQNNRHCR